MNRVTAKVTLARQTEAPQELIASAAKLCYASDTEGILQQDASNAQKFVAMIKKLGHYSPLEHASFSFLVEGVSRAMTHQLVRHRLASYSQRSQRYVAHADFDFVMPPQLEGKTVEADGRTIPAEQYFNETMEQIAERYGKLCEAMGGKGESTNQDARYILPNACETKIFVTMNARELLHFFSERLCLRAQWEIRGVAEQMLQLVREVCPAVFEGAGPKCVMCGHCPEGKMTCGKYAEIKAKYAPEA